MNFMIEKDADIRTVDQVVRYNKNCGTKLLWLQRKALIAAKSAARASQ